mmetsp:Transcript_21280/g.34294  ORF Transcript_21280/g.34294 Transcript_21280/m.34294 type:complete len:181 (-) Transcript_21280:69-611(-)
MPTHSGEVSFPGGSEEPGDKSMIDTALRETYEEMGIERNRIEVLGQIGEFPSKHNVGVTAVVGILSGDIDLEKDPLINPNSDEIETNFIVAISALQNPDNWTWDDFGQHGKFPRYIRSPHPIWGMTAVITKRILSEIKESRKEMMEDRRIVGNDFGPNKHDNNGDDIITEQPYAGTISKF